MAPSKNVPLAVRVYGDNLIHKETSLLSETQINGNLDIVLIL